MAKVKTARHSAAAEKELADLRLRRGYENYRLLANTMNADMREQLASEQLTNSVTRKELDETKQKLWSCECKLHTTEQVLNAEKADRKDHVNSLNATINALLDERRAMDTRLHGYRLVLADMVHSAIQAAGVTRVDDDRESV